MDASTPLPAGADPSVVDRERLLDRVGGDEDLLREITSIFLEEYPELLRELEDAVRNQDAKRIEHAAHSLKGSVSNFGAQAATQAAYCLEMIGRSGSLAAAPAALADLLLEFRRLHPSLERLSK